MCVETLRIGLIFSRVTPQIPYSNGFNTDLWGFQGERWENIHFESKPRHVIPQINCLRKMRPVLRVSTHLWGF